MSHSLFQVPPNPGIAYFPFKIGISFFIFSFLFWPLSIRFRGAWFKKKKKWGSFSCFLNRKVLYTLNASVHCDCCVHVCIHYTHLHLANNRSRIPLYTDSTPTLLQLPLHVYSSSLPEVHSIPINLSIKKSLPTKVSLQEICFIIIFSQN